MAAPLSEDQAKVYDRQLRVWGVEVQKRLNAAKVLIIGSSGLAAEVAKNIVLAGVGNVTICDGPINVKDAPAGNFLVMADADASKTVAEAAVRTLQEMNPLVQVSALVRSEEELVAGGVVDAHDIVVLVHPSLQLQQHLDQQCREKGKKCMSACIRGAAGFLFLDLLQHTFTPEAGQQAQPQQPVAGPQTLQYPSLQDALSTPFAKLRTRTHPLYPTLQAIAAFEAEHGKVPGPADVEAVLRLLSSRAEEAGKKVEAVLEGSVREFVGQEEALAPVAAVVGGVVANEVVKVAGQHREPIKNLLCYSLMDGRGLVEDAPFAS